MKRIAAFLALALASFALVACGGDDDNGTTTTETGGEATNGAAGNGGGGGAGGASTIQIEAASSGFVFATDLLTAEPGEATVEFSNPQPIGHDADIEDSSGKVIAETDVITEGSDTDTIKDLKPGQYVFFCSVPGHREGGMEGTLTVE